MNPTEIFEYIIFGTKFTTIIVLCLLAIINKDTRYVVSRPDSFIKEALLLGLSAALCTIIIGLLRTRSVPLEGAFTMFLLFFMFSIIREIAGYFPFLMNDNMTDEETRERTKLKPFVLGIGALVLLVSVGIMFKTFKFPSYKTYAYYSKHVNLMFILETLLVTITSLVPEIYIDMKHAAFFISKTQLNTHSTVFNKWNVINFIIYAICHMSVQFGGFYDLFYSMTNSYARFGWQI